MSYTSLHDTEFQRYLKKYNTMYTWIFRNTYTGRGYFQQEMNDPLSSTNTWAFWFNTIYLDIINET